MSISQASAPYFDDYDERKNFAKILFKPGYAVQTRELNQLQTILQKQVQRFGDNILKSGSIVSGGAIKAHKDVPYVKINDVYSNGQQVKVVDLVNKYLVNSAGLKALVVTVIGGQQATAPDLNTLYVRYLNSGNDNNTTSFAPGQTLSIYTDVADLAGSPLQITVGAAPTIPIGSGYGVEFDEGIVYHAGYFSRFSKQLVIVSRYDNYPHQVSVGFDTTFEVVSTDDDVTLYDNASGTSNYSAPGADRLVSTANAYVLSNAEATQRPEFLKIVEFSGGELVRFDNATRFNSVDKALADRTFEESGNYVVDKFNLNTTSLSMADEDEELNVVVDAGVAYVNGYRVATTGTTHKPIRKGVDTSTVVGVQTAVEYGNYLLVDNVRLGTTPLIGSTINLNDTQHALAPGATVSVAGGNLGTARVKGVQFVERSTTAKMRIFLFDINLNPGVNFSSVRSVNGTGFIANISGATKLHDTDKATSIFRGPARAIKALSNVVYTEQRQAWGTVSSTAAGAVTFTLSGSDKFEITGALPRNVLDQIIITPTTDTSSTANLTGTAELTSGSNVVVGTGTAFLTEVAPGDHLTIGGSIVQVAAVTSATALTLTANAAGTIAPTTFKLFYPRFAPIAIVSGTVLAGGQSMTLQLFKGAATAVNVNANIPVRVSAGAAGKTVARNASVRINLATNVAGMTGPWAVGFPDIIHLRGVYMGPSGNTTFAAGGTGVINVTNDFYIDSNHGTDSLGTGYLYKKATSKLALDATRRLLVVFDVLTTSGTGLRTITSYPINDVQTLAASAATMNTLELPEVFGSQGEYYDVRDCFDFRPIASTAAAPYTGIQSGAPTNPTEPTYAARYASIGSFPAPQSSITSDVVYYLGRIDRVVINTKGEIEVLSGQAGTKNAPAQPSDVLTVNVLNVPPYPSVPAVMGQSLVQLADTMIANERIAKRRINDFTVRPILTTNDIERNQPRGYTMEEIGKIDRRLGSVEYYLSLTLAETQAKNRLIPSANSADTERFKFGFFVDSFSDTSQADLAHPQYRASIADGILKPRVDAINIQLKSVSEGTTGGVTTLPFSDINLVEQLDATDGPVYVRPPEPIPEPVVLAPDSPVVPLPETPPVIPEQPVTIVDPGDGRVVVEPAPQVNPDVPAPPVPVEPTPVITQAITLVTVYNQNTSVSINGYVKETSEFFFSSLAGPVAMYYNGRDNDNDISIFQSHTAGFSTAGMTPVLNGLNMVVLTSADKVGPASGMGSLETLDATPDYILGLPTREDAGKILWTHNPANGRYYKIVITKFRKSGQADNWKGKFIYKLFFPTDSTSTVNRDTLPGSFGFVGTVSSIQPPVFATNTLVDASGATKYYAPSQQFRIVATGLKPSTVHSITFDNALANQNVRMVNGSSSIVSDAQGRIEFDYLYSIGSGETEFAIQNQAVATFGEKYFLIQSADGTSYATDSIGVNVYNSTPIYNEPLQIDNFYDTIHLSKFEVNNNLNEY